MAFAAVPTKNPGDVLTSTLWNTYIQGNADSGFVRMLADTTLGAAAASIDFTSIPATFAHLLLVLYLRGDVAADQVTALLRFNGDTGTNYLYEALIGQNAVASAALTSGQTAGKVGTAAGASAVALSFGAGDIIIPHYAGTTNHKAWSSRMGNITGVNGSSELTSGRWGSAAAINRVTVLLSSGNLVAGSRATLYGVPA